LKWLTVSAGVQKTFYGLTDEYIEDLSFNLDSWTLGAGFAFKLTPWMKLQLGYMITLYDEWNKVDALTKLPTEYDRTSHDIAFGFNFDF
jgi:long-chain fatty acid transport protein